MLSIEKKTSLSREDIFRRAKQFFGESGLGLSISKELKCCLYFTGGGGYVQIIPTESSEQVSAITIETREWEPSVKIFLQELIR